MCGIVGFTGKEQAAPILLEGLSKLEYRGYDSAGIAVKEKKECCGCTACYAICSQMAISMIEDEEGFEYPQIDEKKCIKCYQCLKVCPFKET